MEESKDKSEKILQLLQVFQDFTDQLTLRRILTALVAGILSLSLYTLYEHRSAVLSDVLKELGRGDEIPRDWTVSAATIAELDNLIAKTPLVKMVVVTQIDLQKNLRLPRYWRLDDPALELMQRRVAQMLPRAVFDYDERNTQQLVSVLNNEFVCNRFEDTVFIRDFAELKPRIPYICRMAVPPFYGRFVGLLTFGVTEKPTQQAMDALRLEASRLSIQIYLRDVLGRQK